MTCHYCCHSYSLTRGLRRHATILPFHQAVTSLYVNSAEGRESIPIIQFLYAADMEELLLVLAVLPTVELDLPPSLTFSVSLSPPLYSLILLQSIEPKVIKYPCPQWSVSTSRIPFRSIFLLPLSLFLAPSHSHPIYLPLSYSY